MGDLNFNSLRAVNVTRCARWHPPESSPWTAADWSNAMCGEAGEAANKVKKFRRWETGTRNQGDPPPAELLQEIADEIADTIIYADLLANYFKIDVADAIRSKFNRTSVKMGFPERLA
jgi:NTP pyrophosphatase (non-canonical NTP hydrolase)